MKQLQSWTYETLCKGREMKTQGKSVTDIARQEPKVYLAFFPTKPEDLGQFVQKENFTVPSILIMPQISDVKNVPEQRFDRYNHVSRNQEFGQNLNVTFLFSVYEAGIRLPGFAAGNGNRSGIDVTKILEGTEEGFLTLMDWMDDLKENLLAVKAIPGTDLAVSEMDITYSAYSDSNYIVDKRPIHYGIVYAKFNCNADKKYNPDIEKYLE